MAPELLQPVEHFFSLNGGRRFPGEEKRAETFKMRSEKKPARSGKVLTAEADLLRSVVLRIVAFEFEEDHEQETEVAVERT